MPGKGNPEFRMRLPADHWLMRIEDPGTRRREVERALEFYLRYRDQNIEQALEFYAAYRTRLDELRQAVDEIRQAIREGGLTVINTEHKQQESNGDERLFAALDKFLNF